MRSRLWGAPASEAVLHVQTASHPASSSEARMAAKSRPPLLVRAPATFSHQRNGAPHSVKMRSCSYQSPLRFPSRPARFPATERSWQGLPPTTTSTVPWNFLPSNFATSLPTTRSPRARNIRRNAGSISTHPALVQPSRCPASTDPPPPANRCSALIHTPPTFPTAASPRCTATRRIPRGFRSIRPAMVDTAHQAAPGRARSC